MRKKKLLSKAKIRKMVNRMKKEDPKGWAKAVAYVKSTGDEYCRLMKFKKWKKMDNVRQWIYPMMQAQKNVEEAQKRLNEKEI